MSTPKYDYSDSTVVITGGSSGIGREIALRFANADATVINGDITSEHKNGEVPTVDLIRDQGGTGHFVETDIADREEMETLVESAGEFGGVDVMINNAGIMVYKAMVDVTEEDLDNLYHVNIKGTYFGTQIAIKDMLERDDPGTIINTASISSTLAQRNQVQYDATKGAIRMITRGAALEFANKGIRVNGVAPGQIATEITDGWSDEAYELVENEELDKPVPLSRPGTPSDVAGTYLFLASEDAEYITGELVHVDGGWQIF